MARRKISKSDAQAFLKSDRAILLMCMLVALLFWLVVKLSQDFRTSQDMQISYQVPESLTFTNPPPRSLRLLIEGSGWNLLATAFARDLQLDFQVQTEEEFTVGTSLLRTRAQAQLPENVSVLETRPDYIRLPLEARVEKMVPLRLQKQITFGGQHKLRDSIRLQPDSVRIMGPRSVVDTLQEWSTQLLKLNGLQESIEMALFLTDPENQQLVLEPRQVRVIIPAEPFTEKIIFLPIQGLNAPDSLRIFPRQVKVSFNVGLSRYDSISRDSFSATVDLQQVDLGAGANTVPIQVRSREPEVQAFHYSPKSVEFFVVEEGAAKDSLQIQDSMR